MISLWQVSTSAEGRDCHSSFVYIVYDYVAAAGQKTVHAV